MGRQVVVGVVAALFVLAPVWAQDADRLARQRWPDDFVRPFSFIREVKPVVVVFPEERGRNALMRPRVTGVFRDLTDFDRIDHVAIVRFIPAGDGIEIAYASEQGTWTVETRGGEMFIRTGEALEYRAPLVAGWNALEFRCGMNNANTLDRSITIKLNDRLLGGSGRPLSFNGHLEQIFVRANDASVVVANHGVEIGETRRVDQARPRR